MNTSPAYQATRPNWLPTSATVLLGLTLILSGCGDGLSGEKYVEASGSDGVEFKSGNKAYMTTMGQTVEVDYEVDDDKIKLKTPMGTMVLTHNDDGTITGMPMTGPLAKKD